MKTIPKTLNLPIHNIQPRKRKTQGTEEDKASAQGKYRDEGVGDGSGWGTETEGYRERERAGPHRPPPRSCQGGQAIF